MISKGESFIMKKNEITGKYFGSEQQLMDVINFLPDPTLVINREGQVLIWNYAMEELTGIKSEDILGKGDYEYALPFYNDRRPLLVDLVFRSNKVSEKNYPELKKNGDLLCAEVFVPGIREGGAYVWGIAKPLYDSNRSVIGAIETFRDITEQKLVSRVITRQKDELQSLNNDLSTAVTELQKKNREYEQTNRELSEARKELEFTIERLKFSEEKFSKTVHLGPVIITLSRLADGVYVEVSDFFLKLTGYSREEVIGQTSLNLKVWADISDRERLVTLLKTQGLVRELEINFCTRTGQIRLMRYSADIITIAGVQYLVSVAIDITERKKAEEERDKLEKQLLQSQKMESIGRLAGGIAHDFNNLLTAILGNVELAMLTVSPDAAIHHHLEIIQKASESAASLTKQLLAFSRKQIIEPKVIGLNEMVLQVKKLLARLIGENIKIHTVTNASEGNIKVDPGNIEQIIMNLAVNARDAMSEGGVLTLETDDIYLDDLYCQSHTDVLPGDYVMLSVSDTGIGMSEEVVKHIFEPFFTTKPKGKGTGLGLAMVYGAVKQNRGTLDVHSVPGKGTRFKIYFPHFKKEIEGLGDAAAKIIFRGKETILLVEDDPFVLDFASNILGRMGYTVLHAPDGERAFEIEKTYDKKIDLLITDVVLPGMNGKLLAEKLAEKRPDLRVLFSSGYADNFAAHQGGVLDEEINFICKPYSAHALSKKIREILGKK